MLHTILIAIGFFFANAFASSAQHQFILHDVAVLDSALDNKRILLPRLVDTTLWVLSNEVRKQDSANSYYALYNAHTQEYRRLVLPDSNDSKNYIVEFFVEEHQIILVDLVSVLVFRAGRGEQWSLAHRFALSYTALHARKEGDIIYLWNDIPSSYSGKKSRFYCWSFDVQKQREGLIVEFPEPAGAKLMYVQPRNVLDRTTKTIALADITDYTIRVYSADTARVDTITRKPEQWIYYADSVDMPRDIKAPQRYFPKLAELSKSASLISRITLINDTTLLVVWSKPVQGENRHNIYLADVWRKEVDTWSLIAHDVPAHSPADTLPFALPEAPISIGYVYSSGVFLDVLSYPLNRDTRTVWATYADYQKELDSYYGTHPLQYIVTTRGFAP